MIKATDHKAAFIAIILTGALFVLLMMVYLVGVTKGNPALDAEAQRDHAKYYTSEVVALDMDTNNIILENGAQLNVMRGWRQTLVPDIGDVVSYAETIKYYPNAFTKGIYTDNEPIYIDKRVIGRNNQD